MTGVIGDSEGPNAEGSLGTTPPSSTSDVPRTWTTTHVIVVAIAALAIGIGIGVVVKGDGKSKASVASLADIPTTLDSPTLDTSPSVTAPPVTVPVATTPQTTARPATGTRGAPVTKGTVAVVGSWTVQVVSTTPDANAAIQAENQFNDPPAAGKQFYMVRVRATYKGSEASSTLSDLSFKAVGPSNVSYDEFEDDCGVTPDELPTSKDVFQGGTVAGNVCWSVTAQDATALLLIADQSFALDSQPSFFAL